MSIKDAQLVHAKEISIVELMTLEKLFVLGIGVDVSLPYPSIHPDAQTIFIIVMGDVLFPTKLFVTLLEELVILEFLPFNFLHLTIYLKNVKTQLMPIVHQIQQIQDVVAVLTLLFVVNKATDVQIQ